MELSSTLRQELSAIKKELENKELVSDEEIIIPKLSELLINSVKKRVKDEIAIGFSGGLDSSLLALICDKLNIKFKLYCVGLKGSKDLISAKNVADKMNWNLEIKELNLEEAENIIKSVANILRSDDFVRVGIDSTLFATLKLVKKDSYKEIINGLGSEEIFAGYERHRENTHEACWEGLLETYERDLKRDSKIFEHFNIKAVCPFLDKELIKFGMQIDPKLKINDEDKKIILRKAALKIGLVEDAALRPKLAAQYGSKMDKAITKLTKLNGFGYKEEYLRSLIS